MVAILYSAAQALPPQRFVVQNTALRPEGDTLTFFASLTVDEEDGLRDLLKDGAELELTITLVLERHRSWWANADAAEALYSSILRHDPLSRDFILTVPGASEDETLRDRNLTRLLNASWKQLRLPVTDMTTLAAPGGERDYILSASFSLRHREVPPWLEKSFVFWSSDVVRQKTVTLTYKYR